MTGFQAMAGGVAAPYEAPFDGKIVAWSITLARPSKDETKTTSDEIAYFNDFLGSPSEARIGVLRPVEESKPPKYTLVRQSPLQVLNPYFGGKVIFALEHPLTVLQGQVVALTIPTWAPMFAFNVSGENTWRGSRQPEHCSNRADIQAGHPQQGVGKTKVYGCYYSERPPALHGDAGQAALAQAALRPRERLAQAAVRAVADVERRSAGRSGGRRAGSPGVRGSAEAEGASGRTIATGTISSPVSRST